MKSLIGLLIFSSLFHFNIIPSKHIGVVFKLPMSPINNRFGDKIIESISYINNLIYENKVEAYILLEDLNMGKLSPKGSLIIFLDNWNSFLNIVDKIGLEWSIITTNIEVKYIKLSPPKIAIWAEAGTDFTLFKVLPKIGFKLHYLYKKDIDSLSIENFDVVILPPGSGLDLAKSLGETECRRLALFVQSGGGYPGVCAGAYLPVKGYLQETSWLEIVNARVRNWPTWSLERGVVILETINPDNPVMMDLMEVLKLFTGMDQYLSHVN